MKFISKAEMKLLFKNNNLVHDYNLNPEKKMISLSMPYPTKRKLDLLRRKYNVTCTLLITSLVENFELEESLDERKERRVNTKEMLSILKDNKLYIKKYKHFEYVFTSCYLPLRTLEKLETLTEEYSTTRSSFIAMLINQAS